RFIEPTEYLSHTTEFAWLVDDLPLTCWELTAVGLRWEAHLHLRSQWVAQVHAVGHLNLLFRCIRQWHAQWCTVGGTWLIVYQVRSLLAAGPFQHVGGLYTRRHADLNKLWRQRERRDHFERSVLRPLRMLFEAHICGVGADFKWLVRSP